MYRRVLCRLTLTYHVRRKTEKEIPDGKLSWNICQKGGRKTG